MTQVCIHSSSTSTLGAKCLTVITRRRVCDGSNHKTSHQNDVKGCLLSHFLPRPCTKGRESVIRFCSKMVSISLLLLLFSHSLARALSVSLSVQSDAGKNSSSSIYDCIYVHRFDMATWRSVNLSNRESNMASA